MRNIQSYLVSSTKSVISSVLKPDCTTTLSFNCSLLSSSDCMAFQTLSNWSLLVILKNFSRFRLSMLKLTALIFRSSSSGMCGSISAPLVVMLTSLSLSLKDRERRSCIKSFLTKGSPPVRAISAGFISLVALFILVSKRVLFTGAFSLLVSLKQNSQKRLHCCVISKAIIEGEQITFS